MPNAQYFEYYAFISYSRVDESRAKWLQKKMEQYRLPTVIRKQESALPKKVRPIFRDKTDLTSGQLGNALRRELEASKKLIVICSPTSARSEWVNREVAHFIAMGRIADIIPLIVEGTPNSGDQNECFPPALRLSNEDQLLGVSIGELGKKDALLRIIASLLGIKFDQLKRRHEQRRRRLAFIISTIITVFVLLSGIAGYKAWDYFVPHERYFADYVLRWGVPEGIIPLNAQEVAVRQNHYRMVTERGLVRQLIFANSVGMPVPHEESERLDRPMITHFYYHDDGRIQYIEYIDNNGKILSTQVYTTDLRACDFQASGSDSSIKTLSSSTTNMATGMFGLDFMGDANSDVARFAFEYDENGFVTKTVYMRDRRTPVLDADGIGGIQYILDEIGRPIEMRYLGINGDSFAVSRDNIAGKRYTYDDTGNITRAEYYGADGEPVFNEEGWMICEFMIDDNGNIIRKSFFDATGNLIPTNNGYSYSPISYDERGNRTGFKYYNADGNPVMHIDGMQAVENRYDERGWMYRQAFYDENGEPVLRLSAMYHAVEYEFDDNGNYTRAVYYGTDGEPIINVEGYASCEFEYDERGNRTLFAFFDENGDPVLSVNGSAVNRTEYDERDNRIRESWYGTDDKPIIIEDGYASCVLEYDDRNNVIRRAYFGVDNEPVLHNTGVSSGTYVYDSGGNCTRLDFYGTDGRPCIGNEGYSTIISQYDERGNMSTISFYDVSEEPVICSYGYASGTLEYNERGDCILQTYLDLDGNPVISFQGCAGLRAEYDSRGKMTRMEFLDTDGSLIISDQGVAVIVFEYDSRGYGTGMSYLGTRNEPVNGSEGYHRIYIELDERGQEVELFHLDAEGNILTKRVLQIIEVGEKSISYEYGIRAGDYAVRCNDWEYFRNDPGDSSSYLYSLLMEVLSMSEYEYYVIVYRASEGVCIRFDMEGIPDFVFETEMWINDNLYREMKEAYANYSPPIAIERSS